MVKGGDIGDQEDTVYEVEFEVDFTTGQAVPQYFPELKNQVIDFYMEYLRMLPDLYISPELSHVAENRFLIKFKTPEPLTPVQLQNEAESMVDADDDCNYPFDYLGQSFCIVGTLIEAREARPRRAQS